MKVNKERIELWVRTYIHTWKNCARGVSTESWMITESISWDASHHAAPKCKTTNSKLLLLLLLLFWASSMLSSSSFDSNFFTVPAISPSYKPLSLTLFFSELQTPKKKFYKNPPKKFATFLSFQVWNNSHTSVLEKHTRQIEFSKLDQA